MSNNMDRAGKIILFHNTTEEDKQRNRPHLSGSFFAHRDIKQGEEVDISLWVVKDDDGEPKKTSNGKTYSSGQLSDKMNWNNNKAGTPEVDLLGNTSSQNEAKDDNSSKKGEMLKSVGIDEDDSIPF